MPERCSVCGQPLPAGLTAADVHQRIERLTASATKGAIARERKALERQFETELAQRAAEVRKSALREARASSRREVDAIQRKLQAAEAKTRRAIDKAAKDARTSSHREMKTLRRRLEIAEKDTARAAEKAAKQAAAETTRLSRKELDVVKERAAKERAQHAADTARLKSRVDELSLKLERQTSEQMGEMTEADALAALKRAFPHDDIQRIGRGVRGADILHKVMHEGAEAGRIVYECKNVSTWQTEWLTKARSYRTEYQTPWVVIASRCFPRREKWFVVERGVPVIELQLVVRLAEVIRGAIVEIGSLRLTTVGRQAKAAQMFDYVLSDHFASRVKNIGEAITGLRTQQDREKQWHAEAWAKEVRLFDEVDGSRREITAQVRAIAEASPKPSLRVVGGRRA